MIFQAQAEWGGFILRSSDIIEIIDELFNVLVKSKMVEQVLINDIIEK